MKPLTLIPAIHRAAHAIATFVDADTSLPVTQAEAHVLAHLAARGDCTVGEIHKEFGHKRSTLTSILNRLEDRSLITCQVNLADKRSLMIGLTQAGNALADHILSQLAALEAEIMGAFSPRDQKNALWVLTAVRTVVEKELPAT